MILFSSRIFIWACLISLALSCGPRFAFAEETIRRNVEVQWDAIVGASQYEVQVQNKGSDTKPLRFKTSVPKWSATIKPGFYIMTIRSFDDRGVPGTWSPPSELQVKLPSVMLSSPQPGEQVRASDDTTQDVKLRWEAVPGAEKYKVTLHSKISSYSIDQEVRDTSLTLSLPVGEEFEWNAIAVEPSGQIGDPNLTAQPFLLQGPALPKPNIEKPLSKYVREIKWSSSVNAKSYSYELLLRNPQTKKWDQIEHQDNRLENSIALDISRPSGRYRIKVQAKGERRDPSKIAQLDFATYGGFHNQEDFETARTRDSLTKPSSYYMIASYLITQIQYSGINHDQHATSTFQALGGTGRIGLGYQPPDSKWGGFGIIDYSGFTIHGHNFTFSSAEGHLTHKLEFGQGGLLLFGAGLFSKDLPSVSGNSTVGFQGVGTVRTFGPHAGFTYWTPLNERFGIQANARGYYSVIGSTNGSTKTNPTVSYQLGLLGSYRLSPKWMGLVGVAVRKDEANYEADSGQLNSIQIQGTYLNLLLEYSF